MGLDKKVAAKWVKALRSGEYPQSHGTLRNKNDVSRPDGFCCLGVLCDVYRKETGIGVWADQPNDGRLDFFIEGRSSYGGMGGGLVPLPVAEWSGVNHALAHNLSNANDNKAQFPEIASMIEKEAGL